MRLVLSPCTYPVQRRIHFNFGNLSLKVFSGIDVLLIMHSLFARAASLGDSPYAILVVFGIYFQSVRPDLTYSILISLTNTTISAAQTRANAFQNLGIGYELF